MPCRTEVWHGCCVIRARGEAKVSSHALIGDSEGGTARMGGLAGNRRRAGFRGALLHPEPGAAAAMQLLRPVAMPGGCEPPGRGLRGESARNGIAAWNWTILRGDRGRGFELLLCRSRDMRRGSASGARCLHRSASSCARQGPGSVFGGEWAVAGFQVPGAILAPGRHQRFVRHQARIWCPLSEARPRRTMSLSYHVIAGSKATKQPRSRKYQLVRAPG